MEDSDCVDGFLGAFWARPAAYLDPTVRGGISSFPLADPAPEVEVGLERLRADLASEQRGSIPWLPRRRKDRALARSAA